MRPCVAYTLNAALLVWCVGLVWFGFMDGSVAKLTGGAGGGGTGSGRALGGTQQQKLAIAQMAGLQRQLTERDVEVARLEVSNKVGSSPPLAPRDMPCLCHAMPCRAAPCMPPPLRTAVAIQCRLER